MDWLFARPTMEHANHWLAILSLVLFVAGVIWASVASTRPGLPPFSGKYTQGFVMKACTLVGWICGIGVFFGVLRFLQIDPATLGRSFWIVLTWIALVVALAWLARLAPADREQRRINNERLLTRKGAKPSRKIAA